MTGKLTENDYALWLFNIRGIGNKSIDKLLCGDRTCKEIYGMDKKELSMFLSEKQVDSLIKSRNVWDFEKERRKLENKGIRFISRIDDEYPEKLKNIADPPFALYVKGRLPNPDKPAVAIIGARMCSEYGRYMARQIGRGLAFAGVQVISGMARGVDGISQKAALQAGGASYAIVGSGVDVCYPDDNRDVYEELCLSGGVISEYPPGTEPKANFFPMRNRIISALSDVVVVVEARRKSGTQITVDTALEQGKEVLACPGRLTDRLSDGCNYLISQGAGVVIDVNDVIDRLWHVRSRAASQNRALQMSTADAQNKPLHMPVVAAQTGSQSPSPGSEQVPAATTQAPSPETTFAEPEPEEALETAILESVDVIPISSSGIMEKISERGIEISVPELMKKLFDMSNMGKLSQNGVYFLKREF
ncbi:DNA-processing protein DprA [Butyrivibrio sp. INlla21]|uniref:DNA-processing protein DprA n=1 Tax=Butyrivibrio sp. INlla21 TaxID=1520811 RepID=UPI0008EA31EC|nr:DNA-processing protein DprA [Butyrivibrio sp. INlla21]SFU31240.1 DNA processing protein [Butyrivibrio sp. INlla21]